MTLLEVLVASALMAILSLVLYRSLVYATSGRVKQSSASIGDRACANAVAKIEQILLTAKVYSPSVGTSPYSTQLTLAYPARNGSGDFALNSRGNPTWDGPARLELITPPGTTDRVLAQVQAGRADQPLARLGPDGAVGFTRVDANLLRVEVVARDARPHDATRSYRSRRVVEVYLQDQGS